MVYFASVDFCFHCIFDVLGMLWLWFGLVAVGDGMIGTRWSFLSSSILCALVLFARLEARRGLCITAHLLNRKRKWQSHPGAKLLHSHLFTNASLTATFGTNLGPSPFKGLYSLMMSHDLLLQSHLPPLSRPARFPRGSLCQGSNHQPQRLKPRELGACKWLGQRTKTFWIWGPNAFLTPYITCQHIEAPHQSCHVGKQTNNNIAKLHPTSTQSKNDFLTNIERKK